MTENAELAQELESIVRAVPGVSAVYPAAPIVVTVVATVVATVVESVGETVSTVVSAVGGADSDMPAERATTPVLITVATGKTGLRVAASIGVSSAESSTEVSRRVHDVIAANPSIAEFSLIDSVTVTVVSID